MDFRDNSTAANGTFIVGGGVFFWPLSGGIVTAGNGLFIINSGGSVNFFAGSGGGNATLIANSGGRISFRGENDGGGARIELFDDGSLDITDLTNGGFVSVGSIEGDGLVLLGNNQLISGSNDLSTAFYGTIQDYGDPRHPGSLQKIGSGTLTLGGENTYFGGTTVEGGKLVVANQSGSGTGTGPVNVTRGKLGGTGTIAGATTVGSGSGTGAFLAPAAGLTVQATLIIHSALTLNADATYTCTFRAKPNKARTDQVVANGVTINSGAMIALSGQTMRVLPQGLVMTLIHNTSANPIGGTFTNLPDGSIVTINGNNFQASYEGGDGNDLTLTVVP